MYVRSKQFFGRGIFTKFLSRTIRKISTPTLKRVATKVFSNPVLKKVVKKIGKNKHVRNIATDGATKLVDHILKDKTPKNDNKTSKPTKTKIIQAIKSTAKEVSRIPEIQQLANKAGKKLLKNNPDSKVSKTLSEITNLFSKKKTQKKPQKNKKTYTPVLKKAKKRVLQNLKTKTWKKLTVGNGLILE